MKIKPITTTQRLAKDKPKPREFCGTVEGLDLRNPACLVHINDLQHAVGRTHRSASEAFRDAEYSIAIELHKSDWAMALEWFGELFMTFFWIGAGISLPILFVLWLFK